MDANRWILILAVAFLVWWILGVQVNRRRANAIALAMRRSISLLGSGAGIRPLGSAAFRVDVEEPAGDLTGVSLVCLLEPRDFPLAWIWMRLRGHRDRIIMKCSFRYPPAGERKATAGEDPPGGVELEGLTALRLQPQEPHLHLAFNLVGPDAEDSLRKAFQLVSRLASEAGQSL